MAKNSPNPSGDLPAGADIVVIGGGLSGLELAKELDRAGASSVVVLEAGPADDLAHINSVNDPDTALNIWLDPRQDKHFWRPWASLSAPHYDLTAGLRRRVGGRSLYWHGVTIPIEPWAFADPAWPTEVVDDLRNSWNGGPALYDRVLSDIDEWRAGAKAPGDGLPEFTFGKRALRPTPRAVRDSAWPNGQRWGAYTPADYWSDEPAGGRRRHSNGVRIVSGVEVLDVVVEHGRVAGVTVRPEAGGQPTVLSCATAVLAAGTIENSRLAIQAFGQSDPARERKLTGLVDHIAQGFVAFVEPASVSGEIRALAETDAFYFVPCADQTRSNMFVRVYLNGAGALVLDVWTLGEQLPSDRGSVECRGADQPPWETVVRAGLSEDDWDVVRRQRDELQDFWADSCDLLGQSASTIEFPDFQNPDRMLENVLPELDNTHATPQPIGWCGPLGSEYHEACTLPLGKLLDERQEFIDIAGLYAVGPSIFPRAGAANPSLTSLALSKRLAGILLR